MEISTFKGGSWGVIMSRYLMDNSSIVAVIIVFILSFNCYGKEYELEKFSYSGADGIVHEQVLSVNTLDIEGSLDFNPTVTTVPLSIDKALMFAKKAYIEKFNMPRHLTQADCIGA